MREDTRRWIDDDKACAWHPFTPQDAWVDEAHEPLVLVRGEGVWLWDSEGERYLDGNASIWTNIHGHCHPEITAAIKGQLDEVAHTSYLGFANPRASELAQRLVSLAPQGLDRVFFSDNGSTAIEVAMKMAVQFRLQSDEPARTRFAAFHNAYHGDTMGAASLGGVSRFFERFRNLGVDVDFVGSVEELNSLDVGKLAAVVIEPLVQGVNEMRPWPVGMLRALRTWCDERGVHLILDEVMTGFGRTGSMFACEQESVVPDFLCLAKGLTGGYLPLAATLTRGGIYDAFRGGVENAFYYGHSFTANPLGCAAALANLRVFAQERTLEALPAKVSLLDGLLTDLESRHPCVHEVRQCGMVTGIELRQSDGSRFDDGDRMGERVSIAARKHAMLSRPIRDTLVFLPPLCISAEEIRFGVEAFSKAIGEVLG